ncbi:MAG: hypothetical protein R6V85_07385 [Polyangia bacterium]
MGTYRPSPLVRWPLHAMNALLILVVLAIAATMIALCHLGLEPPWTVAIVGAVICSLFLLINLAVISLRLDVDERGARLRVWPWSRRLEWKEASVHRTVRRAGLVAVRIRSTRGRGFYLSPAWFRDFGRAWLEIEQAARAAGAEISESVD